MYKAVFIDIDGTLVKNDHTISPATIAVIQRLKEKNMLVVLVSARPLHGILPISKEIGLLDFPVISLNGAYVTDKAEVIFESTIDITTTALLHEQLSQYDATVIYYQQMQWYSEWCNAYTDEEQIITGIPLVIQPFNDTLSYWQSRNEAPNKILVIAEAALTGAVQDNLKFLFGKRLNIYNSKPTYLELMNVAASKTNAVNFLIKRHNINREHIIAIGDNFNDKDMIDFAGTGIAMGNAPDEVKAVADYVTDTNNNDGVAKALIKLMNL